MNQFEEIAPTLNVKVTLDFSKLDELWCVYSHTVFYDDGPRLLYIGVCRVVDIFKNHEPARIEDWRKHVQNAKSVELTIMAVHEDRPRIYQMAMDAVDKFRPYCNLHGMRDVKRGPVFCVTDDVVFDSASQACKHYGISPGTMSRMLNGNGSVKTIHGKVFKYV